MKILSAVLALLLVVKLTLSESIKLLVTIVMPVVLTGTLAYLVYSIIYSLFGYLVAIPFTMLFAYPFYFLITLASMNIYLACGGREEICYGIGDDCEVAK